MRPWLAAAFLLAATPVLGQTPDLFRDYTVEGRNADGSAYSGDLTLTEGGSDIDGDWTIGSDSFRGVGRLEGRVLTLQWEDNAPPVIYVLMPDGTLHGTWGDGYALERAAPK